MPTTTKTLSPAELAKLEHAFASDPASEAYRPLAEAYLGMGRFMEAMVVCKKGVKAHPSAAQPRVLLARVYAAQAKDKKALEELTGALQVAPNDVHALRLTGTLQLKAGEAGLGKESLIKAFHEAPADEETLAAMQQYGIEAPKPAPRPVAPTAPVSTESLQLDDEPNDGQPMQAIQAPVQPLTGSVAGSNARRTTGQTPALTRPASSGGRAAVARPRRASNEISEVSEVSELSRSTLKKRAAATPARLMFFALLFAVPLAAGAYYGIGQWNAKRTREVRVKLREAEELIKGDTFYSYKKACEAAERALDVDPSSVPAHRVLAYAYTVRWGEHERDDQMRQKAEEHLTEGRSKPELAEGRTYEIAADALFKFYDGKAKEALASIEEQIRLAEAKNQRSATLYLTQGIIQMNQGDLESAKESLEKAQQATPDDPRVFIAMGTLARRRGNDQQALSHFQSALKYTRNSHPEALLGTALLVLDQENPNKGYITAATYLKTLLNADPPPSPRQLALGHMVKALLVSRVAHDLPLFTSAEFKKELETGTGISADASKAKTEISTNENEALAKDRNNPELFIIRAKRLFYEDRLDEAATEVRNAIAKDPAQAHFHVELARVLMRKEGGESAAEDALQKALSLVPNSPKLLSMLGQAQYRGKKVDAARATLEKATQDVKMRNPDARLLLGRILKEKKEYDRAAAMFEQASREYFSDPTQAATAFDELGQVYEDKKDIDKARVAYEKAISADKEFTPGYCHYAKFLAKGADAKDRDKAKAIATEGLKLEPNGTCANDLRPITGT